MKRNKEQNLTKKTFEQKVGDLRIDVIELLSRKVVDTTINRIIFRVKENYEKEQENLLWKQFVRDLKENNDLEKIHKTDTKFKSKFGRSIVGFDIYKKQPHIWFGDANSNSNQSIRINGMQQYAIVVDRTYSTINGGTPILRNRLVITKKNTNYLFMGGFGVQPMDQKQIDKINLGKEDYKNTKESWVPLEWANLKVPSYIVDNFKVGAFNHNYGVLPCTEMLNKDFIDNDMYAFENEGGKSDIMYADWYPAQDLIDLYNAFLNFFGWEILLDHTRVIGQFSQQDMNNITNNSQPSNNVMDKVKNMLNGSRYANNNGGEVKLLSKKLLLKSIGGENNKIEKMQTTLKGLEHIQSMEQLTTYIFKTSGYSWDTDSAKVYENVSQTMNASKGVYETTKEKITLFERQWKNFYSKIAFAYFKLNGCPFLTLEQCEKEFEDKIEFQIISNVLQQENNDWKKVIELKDSGLISMEKAIKDINPELSEKEILDEITKIDEANELEKEKNMFNNEDFNGFEANENPAFDNQGEKEEK